MRGVPLYVVMMIARSVLRVSRVGHSTSVTGCEQWVTVCKKYDYE